jgi:hypothetical protein
MRACLVCVYRDKKNTVCVFYVFRHSKLICCYWALISGHPALNFIRLKISSLEVNILCQRKENRTSPLQTQDPVLRRTLVLALLNHCIMLLQRTARQHIYWAVIYSTVIVWQLQCGIDWRTWGRSPRSCMTFRNMLTFYVRAFVSTLPNPQMRRPLSASCGWLVSVEVATMGVALMGTGGGGRQGAQLSRAVESRARRNGWKN